mmetsp:Transcript_10300/g.24177  ORF Transcript_10300/g.24177 Transcript_10300/m.24177 type:complete len:247 (+) Transcript_10300:247-987(+)
MDTQRPLVPWTQSRMWSKAADAADAALDAPRASMMAAPRFWTFGMKSPVIQASSPITALAALPPMVAWERSGYWVEEWLPQMASFSMSSTAQPSFWVSWPTARLWSRRIMAEKLVGAMSGALAEAMRQLVLAGLPTISTFTFLLAEALMALPVAVKMAPLSLSRSPRSMPGPRGLAPTRKAKSAPSKALFWSSVWTMPLTRGKAQSSTSMHTPLRALIAPGNSRSCRITGWSGPKRPPLAMRKTME